MDTVLSRIFAKVRQAELARGLKITPQAVNAWDRVPGKQVIPVERLTGIPRGEIRPDLYPAETAAA